jgi:dienelactone hydrolase
MRAVLFIIFTFLSLAPSASAQAAGRQLFTVQTSGGSVAVESFGTDVNGPRPAVIILSGSRGFGSPAYDEIGKTFEAAGLDAYLVHALSPADLKAIASAGSAHARIAYYATRQSDWIAAVRGVVSYLSAPPRHAGKVAVLGISLGAQIASAASANRADIGALVLVDGGFPDGYLQPVHSLPPLLLIWGREDQTFPLSGGRKLRQMAQDLGGPASLDVYEGAHGFFLKSGTPQSGAAHKSAASFFLSQLSK